MTPARASLGAAEQVRRSSLMILFPSGDGQSARHDPESAAAADADHVLCGRDTWITFRHPAGVHLHEVQVLAGIATPQLKGHDGLRDP
jgi:hypothetical protein